MKKEETIEFKSHAGAIALPWILFLLVLALGVAGYLRVHRPLADELEHKNLVLAKANADLEHANAANSNTQGELQKLQDELKQARTDLQQSAASKDADSKLLDELKKQAGAAEIKGANGQITLTLVDRVLFKSGEAALTPEGEQLLLKLGGVLKSADKLVEVSGHADNTPVKSEIRQMYPTNWELSTARATNVVRFLQDQVGLNPRRMKAAGYGSYRPVASNSTAAGRAKNRRIEVLLLPNNIKTVKGDFADEIAAAEVKPLKHPAVQAAPGDHVKAVVASRTKDQRHKKK
jgi:chemotaxis protein MotB